MVYQLIGLWNNSVFLPVSDKTSREVSVWSGLKTESYNLHHTDWPILSKGGVILQQKATKWHSHNTGWAIAEGKNGSLWARAPTSSLGVLYDITGPEKGFRRAMTSLKQNWGVRLRNFGWWYVWLTRLFPDSSIAQDPGTQWSLYDQICQVF